jgi:peptidoglycan pentaglycine glycine transferase (the first glycine)
MEDTRLEVSVSKSPADPEWDSFLDTLPDGCYQQSSLWAQLKSSGKWKSLRLVVRGSGAIVGGAQIFFRPCCGLGAGGYVAKGPVVAGNDPAIGHFVLDQLERIARAERIRFLKIQPPWGANETVRQLRSRGAIPSDISAVIPATARIDLAADLDAIFARIEKNKRNRIRRGEKSGIAIRPGTAADLPEFNRLMEIQGRRSRFTPHSGSYTQRLWSLFEPSGRIRMVVAEYQGETLAATINLTFGDVSFGLLAASSDRHRELNAHSFLAWESIRQSKARGSRWFDFGGISAPAAALIQAGEPIPDDIYGGQVARFKMSFGSELLLRPGALDISFVWPRPATVRVPRLLMKFGALRRKITGSSPGDDSQ